MYDRSWFAALQPQLTPAPPVAAGQIVRLWAQPYNYVANGVRIGANQGMGMQKQLLSTALFTVEQREFLHGGGGLIRREIIVHPGAVVILPVRNDGRLVLIRNFRYAVEQELLELPAGTLEEGEEPVEAARRELAEETGYRAGNIEALTEFYMSPGILNERMHAFVARELDPVGQRLQNGERIAVQIIDPDEARRMLREGCLRDAKTIATLATYFSRQGVDC
jgi:nudix-type nucleoside diphosphatase (YffH/AdpP family)